MDEENEEPVHNFGFHISPIYPGTGCTAEGIERVVGAFRLTENDRKRMAENVKGSMIDIKLRPRFGEWQPPFVVPAFIAPASGEWQATAHDSSWDEEPDPKSELSGPDPTNTDAAAPG